MKRRQLACITAVAIFCSIIASVWGIQTEKVELGRGGVYDGEVRLERDMSGNLTLRDQNVTTPVSLSTLKNITLPSLPDVSDQSPTNGQFLLYNLALGLWKPASQLMQSLDAGNNDITNVKDVVLNNAYMSGVRRLRMFSGSGVEDEIESKGTSLLLNPSTSGASTVQLGATGASDIAHVPYRMLVGTQSYVGSAPLVARENFTTGVAQPAALLAARYTGNANNSNLYALIGSVNAADCAMSGSYTLGGIAAGLFTAYQSTGPNELLHATAVHANPMSQSSAGHVYNAYGLYVQDGTKHASGTIDNQYGVYLSGAIGSGDTNFNTATNNYGIYLNDVTASGSAYAIYTKAGDCRFGDDISVVGDVTSSYAKSGGNEFLAQDVIRHTLTSVEASSHSFSESWNKATTRKIAQISVGWLKEADPNDTWRSGGGSATGGGVFDVSYNGTTITVADVNSRMVEGDVASLMIVYEK